MQGAQDTLIDVMARTLSPGRRVLLVQTSFDLLTTLAVLDVRELVHLSPEADPDAPSSQAPNGARLHLRPDWKERPRSKDLIVDPLGIAPPEQVERILKKNGLYLTRTENSLTESLGQTQTVSTEWLALLLANKKPKNNRLPTAWADTPRRSGPSVVVASRPHQRRRRWRWHRWTHPCRKARSLPSCRCA